MMDRNKQAKILAELTPQIMNAFHDLGRHHPQDHPLTMRQYQAIIILHANRELTISEFCKKLNLAASTGTELANRLISMGYFAKSTAKPDQRQAILTVKEKGLEVVKKRQQSLAVMFSQLIDRFSEEDRKQFVSSFQTILDILMKYKQR